MSSLYQHALIVLIALLKKTAISIVLDPVVQGHGHAPGWTSELPMPKVVGFPECTKAWCSFLVAGPDRRSDIG